MASISGNLTPQDEYLHPVAPDEQFSENMLFTFFEPTGRSGGFVRLGNRVNEGHAEMTVCIYLPDGRVLFQYLRPHIEGNDAFDAGGLKFEVLEPTACLRTTYDGEATVLPDGKELFDPGRAFKNNPKTPLKIDVTYQGVSPVYGYSSPMPAGGHYEQHMLVTGPVEWDGGKLDLQAQGVRDHSWGRRNWGATYCDRTIWCTFGPDLGFAISLTWHDLEGSPPEVMGTVTRGDTATKIVDGQIESDFEDNQVFHTGFRLKAKLEDGSDLALEGRTKFLVPLRSRRATTTYIGQAMTHFTCGDRQAYGLAEYMDLLSPEGKPVLVH
jgi:hypothetical protein